MQLRAHRAMAFEVKAEIHHCLRPDSREAKLAAVRNIAATKAFLWHFQIYGRRIESLTVGSRFVSLALGPQQFLHATAR